VAGVSDRVQFFTKDLFETDVGEASVVTLYLLQALNIKLIPKLKSELRPGTRVVSHSFDMGSAWPPEQKLIVKLGTIPRVRAGISREDGRSPSARVSKRVQDGRQRLVVRRKAIRTLP
jgi:hypothetical protein